jgi:hypothetical protein
MFITNEIASITVLVPGGSGTRTTHRVIPFNVYKEGQKYRAIALIGNEERRLACLPEELSFHFTDHTLVPGKETKEENLGVLSNIVQELRIQRIL